MTTFDASNLCRPYKRKLSHFLDNKYVQDFMAKHKIEMPQLKQGRGKSTQLDERLKPLLEWWLNSGYKKPI